MMIFRSMVYALSFGKAFQLGNGHCAHSEEWKHHKIEASPTTCPYASLLQVLDLGIFFFFHIFI